MHPALFYRPGERLSLTELGAARLDGHVVEVGEGFIPADTVEEAEVRAIGVAALIPQGTAAAGPTAAWIHGAGDQPPGIHHVRRTSATRRASHFDQRVVLHERRAPADDVQMVAGIPVTTPLATAWDLLFEVALGTPQERWLTGLIAAQPTLWSALNRRVEQSGRRPGRRRAQEIVAAIMPSDP